MLRRRPTPPDTRPSSCAVISQAGAARCTPCTTIALKKSLTAFVPRHACPSQWEIRAAVAPCLLRAGVLLKAPAAGINPVHTENFVRTDNIYVTTVCQIIIALKMSPVFIALVALVGLDVSGPRCPASRDCCHPQKPRTAQAACCCSQYSWCRPPRMSFALISQSRGNPSL
jgi:hypothetical protein